MNLISVKETPEEKAQKRQRWLRHGHTRAIENLLEKLFIGRDLREVARAAQHIVLTELKIRFPHHQPKARRMYRFETKDNTIIGVKRDERLERALGEAAEYETPRWNDYKGDDAF